MCASKFSGDGYQNEGRGIYYTPEIAIWLNAKSTRKNWRKIFFKKIVNLRADIMKYQRPRRARAKIIPSIEAPVYTIRLENSDGIRILFDYKSHTDKVEIFVIAVSNKKDFQSKLKKSSEHIVHASSFDRIPWEGEHEYLDLDECTDEDLNTFKQRAKQNFDSLPEEEKTWTIKKMESRTKRATIYDFRLPNIIDTKILIDNEDFIIPQILKLQDHQKELLDNQNNQFLLEGVAGTGKTTILLYRFVSDVKKYAEEAGEIGSKTLFVTHNKKLKDDVLLSLKLFFPPSEIELVSKCVKTVDDLFSELIPDRKEKFPKERKLTRETFRKLFHKKKIDVDLFWEEYRGLLRGYNLNGDNRIISENKYVDEIGRRRGRLLKDQRSEFYSLAEKMESKLKELPHIDPQNGGWDDLDLCKEIITLIKEKKIPCEIEYLYVDEVQDLTAAEIEVLLTIMNNNNDGKKRIAMAGDLSQSIQPSSFTWQALSDVIYDVLDIKVEKHQTLVENYRSTPYLVSAANHMLKLQSELDGESTTELQRPYADENHGEPGLVFFNSEKELAKQLTNNNLPNAACPMLVRDETTKQNMQKLLPKNYHFVETIAKFKGLEKKNILLWQPDSGTGCELDKREDPNRGKMAKKKEYSDSTALLELRYVFVGFTRARYLMGICAPKGEKSFFLKKAIEDCDSIENADISKLALFDSDIEYDDYVEFAREYESAGQWGMAAESYRNCKYEHNYHYCLGMEAIEEGKWIHAINYFSEACSNPGEKTTESRNNIAEYSSFALDEEMERQIRSQLIAKILHHAEEQLSELQRDRLNAETAQERGNWSRAAGNYIDAENFERARFCINMVEDESVKTRLFQKIGDEKKAKAHLKVWIEKRKPIVALSVALGLKKGLDAVFKKKELAPMRQHFEKPDLIWAMKIAKGDDTLLRFIEKHKTELLLKRKNSNRAEENEVFRQLIKTKNIRELDNRRGTWKHLDNDVVTLEQFIIQDEKKYFLQALQSVNPDWNQYEKYLGKFKKLFPQNKSLGLSVITYFNEEKIKFEMKSDSELSQEIWVYSMLAETIRLDEIRYNVYLNKLDNEMFAIERKTSSMISALLILLFAQRNPGNLKIVDIDTLFSADILATSIISGDEKFTHTMAMMAVHFSLNSSKYNSQKIRSSFAISVAKRRTSPKFFMKEILYSCYIASNKQNYSDFKTCIPFPNELTTFIYAQIEMIMEMVPHRELKLQKKEFKRLKRYEQQNIIKPSDFKKIKQLRQLHKLLDQPIFKIVFVGDILEKESSSIKNTTELKEPLTDESIRIEEEEVEEETIDAIGDNSQILDEEFDDIDFSEIISENSENSDESIQFDADDIAELYKDVKGEKHVLFFLEQLKEKDKGDNMEYAKVLIDYSDFSFQSNCGLDLHLRFALMIAIKNEANKLRSLPEPIYIFQKSDEERRRLFMSEPRNKDAILESGLNYSRRILNQNL